MLNWWLDWMLSWKKEKKILLQLGLAQNVLLIHDLKRENILFWMAQFWSLVLVIKILILSPVYYA